MGMWSLPANRGYWPGNIECPLKTARRALQDKNSALSCLKARCRRVTAGAAEGPGSDSRPPAGPGCAGIDERRAAWPGR